MHLSASDFFVHFSNLLLLASYSVRNMLWLRWLAVAAALMVLPYYLSPEVILWPPLFWGCVFMIINLYQIVLIYVERRPVALSADEQSLYDLGFQSLRQRDFVSLVLIGTWNDAVAGDQPLIEESSVSSVCIAISGTLNITKKGKTLAMLEPGHIVGTAVALTGDPSPVSATFIDDGRYIRWPVAALRKYLDKKPDLRVAVRGLVADDLSEKLQALMSIV